MLGSAPIVAGTISLAVGAALASAIRRDGRVAVSFFGDGATGEGVLYESINFAALKRLPIIFACENNLYATHMPHTGMSSQQADMQNGGMFRYGWPCCGDGMCAHWSLRQAKKRLMPAGMDADQYLWSL